MKPLRIYIAAKFSERQMLRELLPILQHCGVEVTSSWVTTDEADFHEIESCEAGEIAWRDLEDISRGDVVVLDTVRELSEGGGGGREFEAGVGYMRHGRFWLVGPERNPFHYKAQRKSNSWEEFILWLRTRE